MFDIAALKSVSSDSTKPWRHDPELNGTFHPEFPDDLMVEFVDRAAGLAEGMWVRAERKLEGRNFYEGVLLNQPNQLTCVRQGDRVFFGKFKEDRLPRFVPKIDTRKLTKELTEAGLPIICCWQPFLEDEPTEASGMATSIVGIGGGGQAVGIAWSKNIGIQPPENALRIVRRYNRF
jgi:hypothetical protein